jgi:hypothetical protein
MSNPDERTAIDQFGSGDKYFGVCTMLATLPGLPMFGHGQIEGFTERYGMEFKRARMEEHPNEGLIAGHQYHIAPLLKNRALFAESANFVLYDFWTGHGTVDENVFAYSNRLHDQRALIIYNNRYGNAHGTIHVSAASMDKESGKLRQRSLSESLAIPYDGAVILAFRDTALGLEYLRRATDLHHHGLTLDLRGYQYVVLLHWRELRSTADQPWDRLCDALHGGGVQSVDEALLKLRLRPLHEALHQAVSGGNVHLFALISGEPAARAATEHSDEATSVTKADQHATPLVEGKPLEPKTSESVESCVPLGAIDLRLRPFIEKCELFFDRALEMLPAEDKELMERCATMRNVVRAGVSLRTAPAKPFHADPIVAYRQACEVLAVSALRIPCLERVFSTAWPVYVRYTLPSNEPGSRLELTWTPVLAFVALRSLPATGARIAIFDKLQLRSALADTFSSMGLEGEQTWRLAARIRVLLWQADNTSASIETKEFWSDHDVRWLTSVNESNGKTYFNKELFEELLSWLQLPALLEIAQQNTGESRSISEVEAVVSKACRAAEVAGYNVEAYLSLLKDDHDKGVIK